MSNHLTNNILTRGNMNISALTKGFILPFFKYEIKKKHGGGSLYGDGYENLQKELINQKQSGVTYEDVDITVFVDWDKSQNKENKEIYVKLIQKKIEVQLLENTKNKYSINVELIS